MAGTTFGQNIRLIPICYGKWAKSDYKQKTYGLKTNSRNESTYDKEIGQSIIKQTSPPSFPPITHMNSI